MRPPGHKLGPLGYTKNRTPYLYKNRGPVLKSGPIGYNKTWATLASHGAPYKRQKLITLAVCQEDTGNTHPPAQNPLSNQENSPSNPKETAAQPDFRLEGKISTWKARFGLWERLESRLRAGKPVWARSGFGAGRQGWGCTAGFGLDTGFGAGKRVLAWRETGLGWLWVGDLFVLENWRL